jgi:hypothetical protein
MTLPNEPAGFAVNVYTRVIHKRHARHAMDLRRTTNGGLSAVLHGQEPVLCEECFPPVKPERKSAKRFTAEPVKVVEDIARGIEEGEPAARSAAAQVASAVEAKGGKKSEEPDGTSDKG